MTTQVQALQELPATDEVQPLGCCAFASLGTCPSRTFDSILCFTDV